VRVGEELGGHPRLAQLLIGEAMDRLDTLGEVLPECGDGGSTREATGHPNDGDGTRVLEQLRLGLVVRLG
jgi:hypothetical protein